jgi:hypothetical protein
MQIYEPESEKHARQCGGKALKEGSNLRSQQPEQIGTLPACGLGGHLLFYFGSIT